MIFTIIGFICLFAWIASIFSDPDTWGRDYRDERQAQRIAVLTAEEIRQRADTLTSGMTPSTASMWDARVNDLASMYREAYGTDPDWQTILYWNELFRQDLRV